MSFDHIDRAAMRAEDRFPDVCTIVRDLERTTDDVLNPTTWQLTAPSGDTAPVYDGPCSVFPDRLASLDVTTGARLTLQRYRARLPRTTEPEPGDLFTVTSSSRDDSLVGLSLRVLSVERRSLAVTRIVSLEEVAR